MGVDKYTYCEFKLALATALILLASQLVCVQKCTLPFTVVEEVSESVGLMDISIQFRWFYATVNTLNK